MREFFTDLISDKIKKVKINNILDFFPDEKYNVPLHKHDKISHFLLVIDGAILVFFANEKIILKEGDGIFIPSNEVHGFSFYQENSHFIDFKILFKKTKYRRKIFNLFQTEKEFIYLYFSYIFSLWERKLYKYVYTLIPGFLKIISIFIFIKEETKELPETIKKCLVYIKSNYSEKITLLDLSKAVHISPRTISYYFTKYLGVSPIEYIRNYKIKIAKILLLEKKRIKEIAYLLGFSSPSHFSNYFKKKIGVSPQKFKS